MFRLQYRNYGSTESLVVNHSVMGSLTSNVGVRWYEFRRSGGVGAGFTDHDQGAVLARR